MLEFLVKEGNEPMLEEQAMIAGVWDLSIRPEDGYLRAVFTHKARKAG